MIGPGSTIEGGVFPRGSLFANLDLVIQPRDGGQHWWRWLDGSGREWIDGMCDGDEAAAREQAIEGIISQFATALKRSREDLLTEGWRKDKP